MSDSNRLQMTLVKEDTLGTTPGTPRMRTVRITGESLKYEPKFVSSAELRTDRMNADPIKTTEENAGGINFELSYPNDAGPMSELFASGFYGVWSNTNSRANDGTADSTITGVATSGTVLTVQTGTAFVVGDLCRFSGFAVAGNNGNFKCTTGSATVPAFAGSGITDEAAPPAAARVKVIGLEGASADLVAAADGITSTTLTFTDFPSLVAGRWIKIGGTDSANAYATAANNSFARIVSVAAKKLTLDNLPAGWTGDAGTGKAIRIFYGDMLRNGTTRTSMTVERGFMDQTTPTYVVQCGMTVGQLDLNYDSDAVISGSFNMNGLSGSQSTTSLDSSPDAASTNQVMSANASVGRISENGVAVTTPNYTKSLKLSINNNLRMQPAVGTVGSVGIGAGACAVTGTIETYFGSNTLLAKLLAGTATNINAIAAKNNQAVILTLPHVTYTSGAPSAGGQNQDVMLPLGFEATYDTTTAAQVQLDRFEYYEV